MIRIGFQKGTGADADARMDASASANENAGVSADTNADADVACRNTGGELSFRLNQLPFENRECRFYEEALLFDGYSIWFLNQGDAFKRKGGFSLSFYLAPLGYSDRGDGIFSLFDKSKKEGFYVLLKKHGELQVGFGNGRMLFSFSSLIANVVKNAWNIITVVFHEDAGWCDLFINGVFSNRKQFPRHMQLKWPDKKAFLGKYTDHEFFREEMGIGSFYGLFQEMLVHDRALTKEEVKELHAAYETGEIGQILPDRSVYKQDVQRPIYHLIPPGKWMNEPHGPVYFNGYYHIFYQANPHAPTWDNIQWGHVVSKDMVHWEDMPCALETEKEALDPDGCWSGSSLIDKEGKPRIFYTAGNDGKFPNQCVAMAEAELGEDMRLPKWKKDEKPVVEQTEGWFGEFRDPFAWLEGDTYFMLVGTGDAHNGGGNAILYSSKDLTSWQSHGFFLDYEYEKNLDLGHVFELPVLLPLRDESGSIACHIFLFCACQIEGGERVETCGFLGKWNPEERSFQKFHEKALLIDLGHGIFTGPSGFVTPDGRSVVFTIAQGMRNGKDAYLSGWAHNGSLPVELSIRNKELAVTPIREIYQLKKRKLLSLQNVSLKEANEALGKIRGNSLFMKVTAKAGRLAIETGEAEQHAPETAEGGLKRIIYYDREALRFGVLDETGKEIGKYRGTVDDVSIGDELVSMEYFLDHSMIEVYLNRKKSISARNYIQAKERTVRLSGTADLISGLELWEMESAY